MKKFFVVVSLFAASAAHASTVKVDTVDAQYTSPTSQYGGDVVAQDFKFEVNPELGRARLDIQYGIEFPTGGGDDSYYGPGESQVLVQGLSFDKTTSQVVFKSESGKTTACASVEISRGGRKVKIKKNKVCSISTANGDQETDDGFRIHHKPVLNVFLNVQD